MTYLIGSYRRLLRRGGPLDAGNCPGGPHRRPRGPNEVPAQCLTCGVTTFALRLTGEAPSIHLPGCGLPGWHFGYCESAR